eukprot:5429112-Heterocapsa_arctica.AAC.1
MAPPPVQPGVHATGLVQAVAMVSAALEAQNSEVAAAMLPLWAAMAATAAGRTQGVAATAPAAHN